MGGGCWAWCHHPSLVGVTQDTVQQQRSQSRKIEGGWALGPAVAPPPAFSISKQKYSENPGHRKFLLTVLAGVDLQVMFSRCGGP